MFKFFKRRAQLRISFVVIVYRMPEQAQKTLYSLSTSYQKDVAADEYEVVVVENSSDLVLGEKAVERFDGLFRYYLREEAAPTPVHAINFGVQQSRYPIVAIMIDGARMVTPGLVHFCLAAYRLYPNAVVAVPGYHIGSKLQQESALEGYDSKVEEALLQQVDWPSDGYRLFEIAVLSKSCSSGVFLPMCESNCLCIPRNLYIANGGCDPRFDLPGGGFINLDLYRRFCDLPQVKHVILPGEGTFHQFHGGATTSEDSDTRQHLMRQLTEQYEIIRGGPFTPPRTTPVYLGKIQPTAGWVLSHSIKEALKQNG